MHHILVTSADFFLDYYLRELGGGGTLQGTQAGLTRFSWKRWQCLYFGFWHGLAIYL